MASYSRYQFINSYFYFSITVCSPKLKPISFRMSCSTAFWLFTKTGRTKRYDPWMLANSTDPVILHNTDYFPLLITNHLAGIYLGNIIEKNRLDGDENGNKSI